MMVNDAALDLITEFEGFVDHWYPDPALGWRVPTCCYGHTDAAGAPFYDDDMERIFSKTEGEEILRRDLNAVEDQLEAVLTRRLSENAYGALVSFTFNLGEGNLAKSTLLKKVNAGDMDGAAAEFLKWNKAGGKVLPGLTRRRAAEAKLFLTPDHATEPSVTNPELPSPIEIFDTIRKQTEKVMRKDTTPGAASDAPVVADAVAKQLTPVLVNATNQEPWYQSRIILGLIAAAVGFIAMRFGVTITQDDIKYVFDNIGMLVTILGGLYALYGRIFGAKKPPLGGGN